MNYNPLNKIYDRVREEVFTNVKSLCSARDFEDYMHRTHKSESELKEYRIFPVPYYIEPLPFFKKYKERCVCYWAGSDPAKEGSLGIVYQLSPRLHVWARLHNWIEDEGNTIIFHLTVVVAFTQHDDFIKFLDDNYELRKTGNTEDIKPKGFGGLLG